MSEKKENIVTRFAPSPTGFMHVGGVRTALYAWLFAKKNNGRFILRIEDTDKEREVDGSIDHIMQSLKWLGLEWDEGPDIGGPHGSYIQSERRELYKTYAQKLIDKGLAYPDPYTEEELENMRTLAEAEKKAFLYRDHRPDTNAVWDGSKPLRFKVPEIKTYAWHDIVWGDLSAGPEALDDFILIKSDGLPTYNFAHIVDDIEMGVTHVMRGQEFISSTPKFLSVYEALDIQPPYFATLPPIMAPDGKKKLGKRDGAKDILEYKKEGFLADAMINFLAFLGWNPGNDREVFSRTELIETFDLPKIQRSGAQLNEQKLEWLNKEHLRKLDPDTRNEEIYTHLKQNQTLSQFSKINDKTFVSKLYPIIFDRISKWSDIEMMIQEGELTYYFTAPEVQKHMLQWKDASLDNAKKHLEKVSDILNKAPLDAYLTPESIKALIFDYATEEGRGNVLWPLRVSLSGREKSPDPFTLLYILGKEESLVRIHNAIALLS